jgi:hypothetical protein
VRNGAAVFSFILALLSLGTFVAAGWVAEREPEVSYLEAALAIPLAFCLALASLSLSNRARARYDATLGRAGGAGLARFSRVLGVVALLFTLTACLALLVFWVLERTDGLQRAPW